MNKKIIPITRAHRVTETRLKRTRDCGAEKRERIGEEISIQEGQIGDEVGCCGKEEMEVVCYSGAGTGTVLVACTSHVLARSPQSFPFW